MQILRDFVGREILVEFKMKLYKDFLNSVTLRTSLLFCTL
jgi:hypothetical protein